MLLSPGLVGCVDAEPGETGPDVPVNGDFEPVLDLERAGSGQPSNFTGYYVHDGELIIEGVDPESGVKSLMAVEPGGGLRNLYSPITSVSGFVEFQGNLHFETYLDIPDSSGARLHQRLVNGTVEELEDVGQLNHALPTNSVELEGLRYFVERCTSKDTGFCLTTYDGVAPAEVTPPPGIEVDWLPIAQWDGRVFLHGVADGQPSLLMYDGVGITKHSDLVSGELQGFALINVGDRLYVRESADLVDGKFVFQLYLVGDSSREQVTPSDGSTYSSPRRFFELKEKHYFLDDDKIFSFADDGAAVSVALNTGISWTAEFLQANTGDVLGDAYYMRAGLVGGAGGYTGQFLYRFDGATGEVAFDTTGDKSDNHVGFLRTIGDRLYFISESESLGRKLHAVEGADLLQLPITADPTVDEYDDTQAAIIDVDGTVYVVAENPDVDKEQRLYRLN